MMLRVQGVGVGSQNRSKIDQKLKAKMDRLLASIFHGFWWVWGGKLGWKIEPRQAKTGQERPRQGKRREGKGKEEEGKGLEGKDVEKCAGGPMSLGGEGFARPLGGRPYRFIRTHQMQSTVKNADEGALTFGPKAALCPCP